MASYNKVILMGNLTRDPEMKYLPSGNAVTNFGIAMNERYTDKQTGEQRENVCFVEIAAWGRNAEIANEYLSKGSPVFLEGSLKFDSWETPEGEKRNRLSVTAFLIRLIGGRQDSDQVSGGYSDATPAQPSVQDSSEQVSEQSEGSGGTTSTDNDIPF